MENHFKKYTTGAYCLISVDPGLKNGDVTFVTTRHGKEVECIVWKKLGVRKDGASAYSFIRKDGKCREEFLRRKLERAEGASERQKRLSQEFHEKSQKDREFLSMGEPVKAGHHSEKRHRRIIEQARRNADKMCEAYDKAEQYEDKAANIKSQMNMEVPIDTPESLECIQQVVAEQKAFAENIKKHNKENPSDKVPTFVLSNHRAKLRRNEKKLEAARKLWDLDYTPEPKKPAPNKQELVNKILDDHGVIFAFNNQQFEEARKPGAVYVSLGAGGFVPKDNAKSLYEALEAV